MMPDIDFSRGDWWLQLLILLVQLYLARQLRQVVKAVNSEKE